MERLNESSCLALQMNASQDGVCYINNTIPYGFWNMSLARNETNTSLTLRAAEEFFKLEHILLSKIGLHNGLQMHKIHLDHFKDTF